MPTIVVAVDFSARTPAVIRAAAEVAQARNARMVLLHVVPALSGPFPPEDGRVAAAWLERLMTDAQRQLDEVAESVPDGVATEKRVGLGAPWETIRDTARATD